MRAAAPALTAAKAVKMLEQFFCAAEVGGGCACTVKLGFAGHGFSRYVLEIWALGICVCPGLSFLHAFSFRLCLPASAKTAVGNFGDFLLLAAGQIVFTLAAAERNAVAVVSLHIVFFVVGFAGGAGVGH